MQDRSSVVDPRFTFFASRFTLLWNDARTPLADFFSLLLGGNSCLSFVKGKSDPKRRTLVDGTLHSDGPAMFLDDTLDDREA